jgi:thioredoxin-like negative regulator of GroEL
LIVLRNALIQPGPGTLEDKTYSEELMEGQEDKVVEVRGSGYPELEQKIQENPEDPFLLIDLAVKTWQDNQVERTDEAVRAAMKFAKDDPDLYLEFGFRLTEQGLWMFSVPNFVYARQYMTDPPPEINNFIEQSTYFASAQENAIAYLREQNLGLDPLLLNMMEIRKALQENEIDKAERMLETVLEQAPPYVSVDLIIADLHIIKEEPEIAREILESMELRDDLPDWIRMEMEELYRVLESF